MLSHNSACRFSLALPYHQQAPRPPLFGDQLHPQSVFECVQVDRLLRGVDQHLAEVGGAFLPNRQWCPWSSRIAREVSVP